MNFLQKIFTNKAVNLSKDIRLVSPLSGSVLHLNQLPDPAFQWMGEGIAISPASGEVVSPADGEVILIFPTKHAIGIRTEDGVEVLIHIGIDTVCMGGEGFVCHVKVGDRVMMGQRLVTCSLELIAKKAQSIFTPIVITNPGKFSRVLSTDKEHVQIGETTLFTLTRS